MVLKRLVIVVNILLLPNSINTKENLVNRVLDLFSNKDVQKYTELLPASNRLISKPVLLEYNKQVIKKELNNMVKFIKFHEGFLKYPQEDIKY